MLEFLTLFLGLMTGPQEVRLASTSAEVVSVELFLDGTSCGVDHDEPWAIVCDLGNALLPHELRAVGRLPNGDAVAEARQLVNIPGAEVAARFVREQGTPDTVRLVWEERAGRKERAATVSLDDLALSVDQEGIVALPKLDPTAPNLLRAEVVFTDTLRAQATMVLGCCFQDVAQSGLTSVPLAWGRRRSVKLEHLQQVLTAQKRPLRTVAVDHGYAEIVVVREGSEWNLESLMDLYLLMHVRRKGDLSGRDLRGLRPGDQLRVVFAEEAPDLTAISALPVSEDISDNGSRSLLELVANSFFPDRDFPQGSQRIADAVAMAGFVAAGSGRARAVVLIRSGRVEDSSSLTPQQAANYLGALRVPLLVWRPLARHDGGGDQEWQGETEIHSLAGFLKATEKLRRTLDGMVIAWVEGSYLPHQIEIAPTARKVRFPQ